MRLFVDSSVLFAMCISRTGAARELVKLAFRQRLSLVVSDYVFEETHDSLRIKAERGLPVFTFLRQHPVWSIVNPTRDDVAMAIGVTQDPFDAPIIAAAKRAHVDALVSFDRKHLHTSAVRDYLGRDVLTPADVLRRMRAASGELGP